MSEKELRELMLHLIELNDTIKQDLERQFEIRRELDTISGKDIEF